MKNEYATQSLKVQFKNSAGFLLDARLDLPVEINPQAFVILSHCFTCTKETLTTARVSRGLAQKGLAVLRFDFTGLGNSAGQFEHTNFTSKVNDLLSASDYLRNYYQAPIALIGHSMGGTAALIASTGINECHSVVTIASPSMPEHVLHHFGQAMTKLTAGEDSYIVVAGEKYPVKPQFIADVKQYDMKQQLKAYNKRVLSIRAGRDELVASQDADDIILYTQAEHKLLHIPDADHLFRDRDKSDKMITEIYKWIITA